MSIACWYKELFGGCGFLAGGLSKPNVVGNELKKGVGQCKRRNGNVTLESPSSGFHLIH